MKILKIVVEVVEGQKLTLTGEQLEAQPGLKRDIIDNLAKMGGAVKQIPPIEAKGVVNAGN